MLLQVSSVVFFSLIPKGKRSHTDPGELVTISEVHSSRQSLLFQQNWEALSATKEL